MRDLEAQGEASEVGRADHEVWTWNFILAARGRGIGSFKQDPLPNQPLDGPQKETLLTRSSHRYILSCSDVLRPAEDVVGKNWQDLEWTNQ